MEKRVAILSPSLHSAFFFLSSAVFSTLGKCSCIIHSHSKYWSPSKQNHLFENMKAALVKNWGLSKVSKMKKKITPNRMKHLLQRKKWNGRIANGGGSKASTLLILDTRPWGHIQGIEIHSRLFSSSRLLCHLNLNTDFLMKAFRFLSTL